MASGGAPGRIPICQVSPWGLKELDHLGRPDDAHPAGLFRGFPRRCTDFPLGRGQGVPSRVPRRRTDFPVGRKAAAAPEGHGVGLLEGERPLHVVTEPPHRHALRPGHPILHEAPERVAAHERHQDARLHPGERSRPVGTGEGLAHDGRAFEAHEGPGAGGVHSEALANVGLPRPVAQRPVHPPAPHQGEQRSDAGIETLFHGKGTPEAVVQLEGIGLLEPHEERLQ